MQTYDWVVVVVAALLAIRGWRRGLIREFIEFVVFVVGAFIAFRMSPALGVVLSAMANIPPEAARIIAGTVVLVLLMVGSVFVSKIVSVALKVVPGGTTANRFGGALVGIGYTLVVVIAATTLLAAVPLPSGLRGGFDASVEESVIGSAIVSPDGVVQRAFSLLSGQKVFGAVIAVRDAVGGRLLAGAVPTPLPSVGDADLTPSPTAAEVVFDKMNAERIAVGADPLTWSSDLAVVATSRATDVYRSGLLKLDGRLEDALRAEGIPGTITAEMVAIGASPDGLAEAFSSTPSYRAVTTDLRYRKAGVGAVEGPYGMISVVVYSG